MRSEIEVTAPPPALAPLAAGLDHLRQVDLQALPGPLLGEHLVALRGLLDALESEFTRAVGVLDRSGAYREDGALSPTAWLRYHCRLAPGLGSEHVRVARRLPDLPETARAFSAGEVGFAHAAILTRTVDEVGLEAAREAQPSLLAVARDHDPRRLRMATRVLRHCVDQDGALAEIDREFERRRVWLSETVDGVYVLSGILDPEGGAVLRTALAAAEGQPVPGDRRNGPQRRADALVDLARRQLDSGELPGAGCERPHLTLTAELATLRAEPGSAPGFLEWGQPVHAETVRRLACDASVTAVALAEDGEPLSVGRRTRVIPAPIRRALVLRDRHCVWPVGEGPCGRPASWCDGHHLLAWADGGATTLANLALVCRAHHRRLHEGGLRLTRGPDGDWLIAAAGRIAPRALRPP